jgi:curved DNA-binding protein CbpA
MAHSDFVDYYELLQISPNAEVETIHRVYKMLVTRYHPDNTNTGDLDKSLLLNSAYETLSSPESRQRYDELHQTRNLEPIELFELKDFTLGIEGETNRRMGILCLLYNRRRSNHDDPGLSILELETMMSFAREHLMFTLWYLRDQGYVMQDDRSDYVVTSRGVDYVEENLPSNKLVYRLLKAAEDGSSAKSSDGSQDEGAS